MPLFVELVIEQLTLDDDLLNKIIRLFSIQGEYNDRIWWRPNTFYSIMPADRASRGYKGESEG